MEREAAKKELAFWTLSKSVISVLLLWSNDCRQPGHVLITEILFDGETKDGGKNIHVYTWNAHWMVGIGYEVCGLLLSVLHIFYSWSSPFALSCSLPLIGSDTNRSEMTVDIGRIGHQCHKSTTGSVKRRKSVIFPCALPPWEAHSWGFLPGESLQVVQTTGYYLNFFPNQICIPPFQSKKLCSRWLTKSDHSAYGHR